MGLQIENGQNGKTWKIDNINRGVVLAVSETENFHINRDNGKVWAVSIENLSPTAGDDYILYIKNTGDEEIAIPTIRLSSTVATQATIEVVTGTAAGGTAVTPVARNLGSANLPDATIENGSDITGLTTGGDLLHMQLAVANTQYKDDISSNIVIPKGKAVALSIEQSTASITGTITLIEEESL